MTFEKNSIVISGSKVAQVWLFEMGHVLCSKLVHLAKATPDPTSKEPEVWLRSIPHGVLLRVDIAYL